MDAAASTYDDMKGLLKALSSKAQREYKVPADECESAANFGYAKASATWEEGRSNFATWVYWKVRAEVLQAVRSHCSIGVRETSCSEAIGSAESSRWTLLDGISDDAKAVVIGIMTANVDLYKIAKKDPPRCRKIIRRALLDLGWSFHRVVGAMSEVAEMVR